MPVNCFLGVPGSGKSYEAVVFHIIPAVEDGRKVVTNLPLNIQHFKDVYGQDKADLIHIIEPSSSNPIPFKTIQDWNDDWKDEKTGQACLFVVDECHRPLPKGGTSKDIEEWFAEHRHKGHDVLLLTQSYSKISKPICEIVHIVYRVRKNVALGSDKSYVRKVQDGFRGQVVNTSIRFYDDKYYPFYKSHTQSNKSIEEAFAKDIVPIWRNWTFIGAAILLPVGLYFLLSRPMPFNQTGNVHKPLVQQAPQSVQTSPVHRSSVQQETVKPNELEQMESKSKDHDKVAANHPFYKLQMHIGGYLETDKITNNIKTLFIYNVLLSQNGQIMARITDRDLTRAGYTIESFGSCLMKITYNNFFDYITCDAPRASPNADKNFSTSEMQTEQQSQKAQGAS